MKRGEGDPWKRVRAVAGRSHKDRQRISRDKVAEIKKERYSGKNGDGSVTGTE